MRCALPAPKSSQCSSASGNSAGHADVGVDQLVVALPPDPRMPGAEVHVLAQQDRVVGPGIQHDRDDPAGVQAGRGDVDGQLPGGDGDAAHPPVADAQDALGVGGHDQVHVLRPEPVVAEGRLDLAGMIHRQVHPARPAVLQAVPLDRGTDRGGIHDRQHLLDVIGQQPVEQHLVAVAHVAEEYVLGQVIGLAQVLGVYAPQVPLDRGHALGQQAGQPERLPLGVRERGAPVQHRRPQDHAAPQPDPRHHALVGRDELIRTFRHRVTTQREA